MTISDSLLELMVVGSLPIFCVKIFSIATGWIFFSWNHFVSEICSVCLRVWSWRLIFPLCCRLAFFSYPFFHFNFTVVSSCHVSFSTVCTLRFSWAYTCFITCVVTFSEISANCFTSESCFCVYVFVAIMTYHGPIWVLVHSGICWLFGDIESIWLFLQVKGKEYYRSVWVPLLDETCFKCVFNEWVRYFSFLLILHWICSSVSRYFL